MFAVGPLVGNAVLVLLGALSSDFMTNPSTVLIAIPSFMFPYAISQLFSGAISDVYGRIMVIISGLVAFSAGLFLIVMSSSIEVFALANFVTGIGAGIINPVVLALLSDTTIPKDIPKRMGIAFALASLSIGLGPFIAGQTAVFSWKYYYLIFLIAAIVSIIVLIISKHPPKQIRDNSGFRLLSSDLLVELRKPLIQLMFMTAFLFGLVNMGTLAWTSIGLTEVFDESLIGQLLLGNGIAGLFAGFLSGLMVKRFGYKLPISIGLIVLLGGLLIFILVGDITLASSIPFVLLGLVSVGVAGGFLFPTLISISQVLSSERRGVTTGIVTFFFFFGSALNTNVYEPLSVFGMNWVYIGIIIIAIFLLFFFIFLLTRMKSMQLLGRSG